MVAENAGFARGIAVLDIAQNGKVRRPLLNSDLARKKRRGIDGGHFGRYFDSRKFFPLFAQLGQWGLSNPDKEAFSVAYGGDSPFSSLSWGGVFLRGVGRGLAKQGITVCLGRIARHLANSA